MTFSDVLLWIAGISWAMAIIPAMRMARAGDRSALGYFALLALVATPLCLAFPGALAWILGGLWLLTVAAPALLLRLVQRLVLARRLGAALAACRLVRFCQPLGPRRAQAAFIAYQAALELGRTAEADRLEAWFERRPAGLRRLARLVALRAEQRWPEIMDLCRDQPAAEVGPWRMRARAEFGDFAGMLADFAAIAGQLEAQRANARQLLAVVLAFAGRADLVAALLPGAAPAVRDYWIATAAWAAGDEARGRALLAGIPAPHLPGMECAIAWRLAHPPRAAGDVDEATAQRFAAVAALAQPWLAGPAARPWCTWAIAAVCVGAFLVVAADDDPGALWYAGGFDTALGWAGNWWRFVAASFLHANLTHLGMNVYALLLLAPPLERALRWWRFLVLYLLAGAGGLALVLVLHQLGYGDRVMVVGASASIMGLIAVELVGHFRARAAGAAWWRHAQIRSIGLVLAIQVAFDLSHPHVSQAGHIGGFLSGVVLALALLPRRSGERTAGGPMPPASGAAPPPAQAGARTTG